MGKGPKKKFYAVVRGLNPGIYLTWDECKAQTHRFPGAIFKGFASRSEAENFMSQGRQSAQNNAVPFTQSSSSTSFASFNAKNATNFENRAGHSSETINASIDCINTTNYFVAAKRNPSDIPSSEPPNKRLKLTATSETTKKDSPTPGVYSSFAQKMMRNMGHVDGQGLGKSKQGISSPIEAKRRREPSSGLGYDENHDEELNAEQLRAVELAKDGENVFITGPAGTGKTVLLHHILKHLHETLDREQWIAVGPTGPSAIAIKGQTIHSFAGIGVPTTVKDFDKVWSKKKEWRRLKTLVLEEVSMISGEFLDRLSDVVCNVWTVDPAAPRLPFGGIQLILCGDFLQLPPIPRKLRDIQTMVRDGSVDEKELFCNRGYAFQSKTWKEASLEVVVLEEVFRQRNVQFVKVLHELRVGNASSSAVKFLKDNCSRSLPTGEDGIKATRLHARNCDVTKENLDELRKIENQIEHTFRATDSVECEDNAPHFAAEKLWRNPFFQQCIAESELTLKIGAQVMLIKNESSRDRRQRLVNGSRGTVVGFCIPDQKEGSDKDDTYGFGGVKAYPKVRFRNGVEKIVTPVEFSSRLAGIGTCIRHAVPLKLAWAITMHKSQGMTLDYVKVDLSGVFSNAQAYVALSRASDENGLELLGFCPKKVRADPRALQFYKDPTSIDKFPSWESE